MVALLSGAVCWDWLNMTDTVFRGGGIWIPAYVGMIPGAETSLL